MASKALKHCALCKGKVKKGKKYIYCSSCSKEFRIPVEESEPELFEKYFQRKMKYCYNCGEDVIYDGSLVECIDECGVKFSLAVEKSMECSSQKTNLDKGESTYKFIL